MKPTDQKAIRTTMSFSRGILDKAQRVMDARDFTDFSGFIQQLIREEWERRGLPEPTQREPREARRPAVRVKPPGKLKPNDH